MHSRETHKLMSGRETNEFLSGRHTHPHPYVFLVCLCAGSDFTVFREDEYEEMIDDFFSAAVVIENTLLPPLPPVLWVLLTDQVFLCPFLSLSHSFALSLKIYLSHTHTFSLILSLSPLSCFFPLSFSLSCIHTHTQ